MIFIPESDEEKDIWNSYDSLNKEHSLLYPLHLLNNLSVKFMSPTVGQIFFHCFLSIITKKKINFEKTGKTVFAAIKKVMSAIATVIQVFSPRSKDLNCRATYQEWKFKLQSGNDVKITTQKFSDQNSFFDVSRTFLTCTVEVSANFPNALSILAITFQP